MKHSIRITAVAALVAASALALPIAVQADTIESAVTSAGSSTQPASGIDSGSLLGLWVGGGALVFAGGAVALAASERRNRKERAGA